MKIARTSAGPPSLTISDPSRFPRPYSASTSLTYHNAWVCAWGGVRELLDKAAGGVNSCFERAGRVIRVLKAGW